MAENLATRMEDSIFKETFSYLRVSLILQQRLRSLFYF